MKNVHILPTPNSSRLSDCHNNKLHLDNVRYLRSYQHIYITSDEKIKEDDWGLSNLNEIILFGRSYNEKFYKKIILTTDIDLIKDGVQAIPDDFLEWFIKNPSCEEVEVVKGFPDGTNYGYNFLDYKIIIPKEELSKDEIDRFFVDMVCNSKEEPNQDIIMELQKDPLLKDFDNQINKKIYFLKQKKETLEEFIKKESKSVNESVGIVKGAKWQQEQDKKLYSDEEVIALIHRFNYDLVNSNIETFKDWFDENKK